MKRISVLAGIMLFVSFSFSQADTTSVPDLINYQGELTDENGALLETKEYKIKFSMFTEPTGGTAVWAKTYESVPVVRGHFNVILGPTDDAGKNITEAFVSKTTYLEITVGDGEPILPRQRILSVPYAISAENSKHAENAENFSGKPREWHVPVGTIAAYWGTIQPSGWLICDGRIIPAGADYDKLRSMVGINTPDLRGMFLRGLNRGRNDGIGDPDGNGRTIGSYQGDLFKSHTHYLPIDNNYGEIYGVEAASQGGFEGVHQRITNSTGGVETRPRNIAVNYIIKY